MIKDLLKLSNHLDSKGHGKEADYLDSIIKKLGAGREYWDRVDPTVPRGPKDWTERADTPEWWQEEGAPVTGEDPGGEGRGYNLYQQTDEAKHEYPTRGLEGVDPSAEGVSLEAGDLEILSPDDIELKLEKDKSEALQYFQDMKNFVGYTLQRVGDAVSRHEFSPDEYNVLWGFIHKAVSLEAEAKEFFPELAGEISGDKQFHPKDQPLWMSELGEEQPGEVIDEAPLDEAPLDEDLSSLWDK